MIFPLPLAWSFRTINQIMSFQNLFGSPHGLPCLPPPPHLPVLSAFYTLAMMNFLQIPQHAVCLWACYNCCLTFPSTWYPHYPRALLLSKNCFFTGWLVYWSSPLDCQPTSTGQHNSSFLLNPSALNRQCLGHDKQILVQCNCVILSVT